MRRAAGPMLVAWLLVTLSAAGVAWVAVHPAAEQGFADRPPVPQPGVFAPSPEHDGADRDAAARPGPAGRGPADPEPREPLASPSGADDAPSVTPPRVTAPATTKPTATKSPPAGPPTSSPPTSSPPTAAPSSAPASGDPDSVYRSADSEGGSATFEYDASGDVRVVSASPEPGWRVHSYRYKRDWVVVEFAVDDHVSTVHAYLHRGRAAIQIIEESR